jgi:8-oxo-dGTP diphosphatase
MSLPKITVTCAVIYNSAGHILLAQRSAAMSNPLLWEFPGGKLEPNEEPADCLLREISEELNLKIIIQDFIGKYSYQYPKFEIDLLAFSAKPDNFSDEPELTEHNAFCWVPTKYLMVFDISPADIELAQYLSKIGSSTN